MFANEFASQHAAPAAWDFPPEVWWHLPVVAITLLPLAVAVHLLLRCLRSRREKKIACVMKEVYDELWDAWTGYSWRPQVVPAKI